MQDGVYVAENIFGADGVRAVTFAVRHPGHAKPRGNIVNERGREVGTTPAWRTRSVIHAWQLPWRWIEVERERVRAVFDLGVECRGGRVGYDRIAPLVGLRLSRDVEA